MKKLTVLAFLLAAGLLLGAILPVSAEWVEEEGEAMSDLSLLSENGAVSDALTVEEASYLGSGSERPMEIPLPECKNKGAEQRARQCMDLWERAVWNAEIKCVSWTVTNDLFERATLENESPVQIGDFIRFLRDQEIVFTRFFDPKSNEDTSQYLLGATWSPTIYLENESGTDRLPMKLFSNGALAIGDVETGYLYAEAGSVDAEQLKALVTPRDPSALPETEKANLDAVQSLYSAWLQYPAHAASKVRESTKESVLVTYLKSKGLTFVAGEMEEEISVSEEAIALGPYLRMGYVTLLADGTVLLCEWPHFYEGMLGGSGFTVLRTAPGAVDPAVVELLLHTEFVRIYNENRLLGLGGFEL